MVEKYDMIICIKCKKEIPFMGDNAIFVSNNPKYGVCSDCDAYIKRMMS